MIDGVTVGEVRPGYELWRPNQEKPQSVTTKFVVVFLLGGAMGLICLIYAGLYAFFAFLVARWSRGILPVAAALSMILAIFCVVGAESWFARDKAGFDEALLPSSLIGLLVILLGLLQLVLIAACFYAFSQEWHVEEERPIGSGEDYGAGAPPDDSAPQPA
jgi:FtsH-binding integral membrane protein